MLGPFRIRNLKGPQQAPLPYSERLSACEAVVALTGNEYQKNVDVHPDSRLTYIDEDDGETVTVGSSAELASRLQDVIPKRVRRVSASYHKSFGKMSTEPPRPPTPDMHVFEIDRTADSVRIWQDIEQRFKDMTTEADLPPPLFSPPSDDNDMEALCDPSDDAARLQEMQEEDRSALLKRKTEFKKGAESAQSLHFARSNPPQLPTRHKTKASEEDSLARYHKWGDSMMDKVSLALPKAPVMTPSMPNAPSFPSSISNDSILTPKAQEQAREAGEAIWNPLRPNSQRFRAAHPPVITPSIPPAPKIEPPAPLLQMFREELAKISKPMERLELNPTWNDVCASAQKHTSSLESASTTDSPQGPKPISHTELVQIVEQLMNGVHGLVSDAQARFTRSANEASTTTAQEKVLIKPDILAVIFEDFKGVTSEALESSRAAMTNGTAPTSQELTIITCQPLLKSLKKLSMGIDTFVTLLSAAMLPQPPQESAPKTEFPNEPLEIEIGNIPDSAGQEQVRNLTLRALSIDGPFSGRPSDILSIRIVPATSEKSRLAQIKFRSHQVAIHVITHLKDSQFGGKTLSAKVPRELNRRENVDDSIKTNPLFARLNEQLSQNITIMNERLDRKSNSTGQPTPSVQPDTRYTSTDRSKVPVENELDNDKAESTAAKPKASNVRFADLPSVPGKRSLGITAAPTAVNVPHNIPRHEAAISFRHVPSPMSGETIGRRRSYHFIRSPSFKSQNEASCYDVPPPHYNEWLKPSRTGDLNKEPKERHAKPVEEEVQSQKTAKEDERLENNPWLEETTMSRDGLRQLSKALSEPKMEQHDAKQEHVDKASGNDSKPASFSNPTACSHNMPARMTTVPTSWVSMAGKYPHNANNSKWGPYMFHPAQISVPQAPLGGWNPSNVKLYHEKVKDRLSGFYQTSPSLFGPTHSSTGNSGRGYPEASDVKNLRHSMSMGAIRKANSTSAGTFGGFGLPARPDAGRDRLASQVYKPDQPLANPSNHRSARDEKSDSSAEAENSKDKAADVSSNAVHDYLTGNLDPTESLAPSVPVLQQTRFPTLEQFEARENAKETSIPVMGPPQEKGDATKIAVSPVNTIPSFPPLPSMELLTPNLPKAFGQNNKEYEEERKAFEEDLRQQSFYTPFYDAPEAPPNSESKAYGRDPFSDDAFESPVKPQIGSSRQSTDTNESSGAFFKRMTGIDTSTSEVFENSDRPSHSVDEDKPAAFDSTKPALNSSTPSLGARLVRPFDPLAETAAVYRHQFIDGVTRSNTVAGHGDRGKSRSRHPYSEYLPRVDDDPQLGSFATLTKPFSGNIVRFQSTSTEPSRDTKTAEAKKNMQKMAKKFKAEMAKSKDIKWGSEWEEKKQAQEKYELKLRRRSMYNLGSSLEDPLRAASPFMDPRPAPGLPNAVGEPTTRLPLPSIASTLPPSSSIPGAFPSPPSPFQTNTAPLPNAFPFIDSSATMLPGSTDASSGSGNISRSPEARSESRKIEQCVEQLRKLGFSKEEDGGLERLRIYAQDANGDVWDAVEMIEGERKVWGERSLGLE